MADNATARLTILRHYLCKNLGCCDDEIEISYSLSGKPFLAAPRRDLWFSTASRDGVLAIALSRRGPVGVDLETLDQCRDAMAEAATLFSPNEQTWLNSQPAPQQAMAFARLWTGKEAALKAAGTGIISGMDQPDFGVSMPFGDPPWPAVVAELNHAPYTVVWYSSIVDEALVIAARADTKPVGPFGLS